MKMNEKLNFKALFRSSIFLLTLALMVLAVSCKDDDGDQVADGPVITDFNPKEGKVNQEVTITGENFGDFADAVKVAFNGTEASISSVSDTQLVVNAPANGTSGPISVSVFGEAVSSTESFTYLASSTVTGIEPETGAPGDEITISGTNFGDDASEVSVTFKEGVEATVVSVTDTEIVVEVPAGGITGSIMVTVGPETVEGPVFNYPFIGVSEEFDADNGGWLPQQDGTASVADGQLVVDFAGGNRADLKFDGSVLMDAGAFPILAIKMTRLGDFNLTLDTDLGAFGGGANKYTGILHGDVYYWDLTSDEFVHADGNTTLSTTEETLLNTLQFKIADVASGETGYTVDFIRSFESVETLKEYAALPTGKYVFEFDNVDDPEWGVDQDAPYVIEDSQLKVTFPASQFEGTNKRRADLYNVVGNTFPKGGDPATDENDPNWKDSWVYQKDYPIYAIKFTNDSRPTSGAFKRDFAYGVTVSDGVADASTSLGGGVYYWDMSDPETNGGKYVDESHEAFDSETGTAEWSIFQFKIADITTEETGYEVDWIRTFKTVEELNAFMQ